MKLLGRLSDKKLLGIIFLLALVIRIGFILTMDNTVDVWGDWWDELGWKIAQGQGFWVTNPYFPDGIPFYSWRAPGFPLFLAVIYKIFGHSFLSAKIGLAVLSALSCILLYLLGKILINKKTGIVCAAIYAFYPAAIFWCGYLAPETLTSFLFIGIMLILASNIRKNYPLIVAGGLVFGYAILTRSISLVFFPAFLIYFFIRSSLKSAIRISLLFLVGTFLIFAPWVIRNYRIHHRFVPVSTEGGIVFFIANNEYSLSQESGFYHAENVGDFRGLSEAEIDRKLYKTTIEFIKKNPRTYVKLVLDRFIRFWRLYPHTISGPGKSYNVLHIIVSLLTETPIIFLGLAGIIVSFFKSKSRRKFVLLYLIILFYSLGCIAIRATIRYRFPIMEFMIFFSVYLFFKNEKCI